MRQWLILATVLWAVSSHNLPPEEVQALIDLNNALSTLMRFEGDSWYCEYRGSCDETKTHVLSVEMDGLSMQGIIPKSLSNLQYLETLILSNNNLEGEIDANFWNLTRLKILHLQQNHLNGTIPSSLVHLTSLKELELSSNSLWGPIPPGIGALSNVTSLLLNNLNLNGTIPESLSNLTSLKQLMLGKNKFSGSLPPQLFLQMTNIQTVQLDHNQFSGPFPKINSSVFYFQLTMSNNNFTAMDEIFTSVDFAVDASFNNLQHFPLQLPQDTSRILLSRNQMSGSLPDYLKDMVGISSLSVEYNNLTEFPNFWLERPPRFRFLAKRNPWINAPEYCRYNSCDPCVPHCWNEITTSSTAPQTTIIQPTDPMIEIESSSKLPHTNAIVVDIFITIGVVSFILFVGLVGLGLYKWRMKYKANYKKVTEVDQFSIEDE